MWLRIFLIILLLYLFMSLSFFWPPDSPWSPRWRTKRKKAKELLKFAGLSAKDTLYELGCGDGEVVMSAVKDFGAKAVGIEIDPARYLVTKFRIKKNNLTKKAQVLKEDFKKVNLSKASVIYMYLVPAGMAKLLPKFDTELKRGTKVLSFRYKVPIKKNNKIKLKKQDLKNRYFLYEIT